MIDTLQVEQLSEDGIRELFTYHYPTEYDHLFNALEWCQEYLPDKSYKLFGGYMYFIEERYRTLFLIANL